MRLYSGSTAEFIQLNRRNQLAGRLRKEFFAQRGYNPSDNEVMSWRNSLLRVSILLEDAALTEQGVFVEYQLPQSSKRIDVILCGKGKDNRKNSVIIELKQWERCTLSDYESDYVVTWVGGGNRNVLHPSVQVGQYLYHLEYNQTAFYEGADPVKLHACSYLHNYSLDESDPLLDDRFKDKYAQFPIFSQDEQDELTAYIKSRIGNGSGMAVLDQVEKSQYRPSKRLLEHVSAVIREKLVKGDARIFSRKDDYILLDQQLVVYDTVFTLATNSKIEHEKTVIIVKGGPGTGKSVIALKLMADLAEKGKNTQYATGSRSFTETLRRIVNVKGNSLFKYFMSYGDAKPSEIDVLIMDEAHRIREKTGYPFKSTGRPQVEDLIRATKVAVFFIDDLQAVRTGEIGRVDYIREHAERLGCRVYEYELESQFRCNGSDAYINWVNNTLQIQRTANPILAEEEQFDFKILSSPDELENEIRRKAATGFTARMMAGFCWPWSKEQSVAGGLVEDVVIGDFKRPWNAPPEMRRLPKDIPSANHWAYDPNGIDQVGCIYTAQGFEFDYAGVIFGMDLRFDPDGGKWVGYPENSYDPGVKKSKDDFLRLVKNTYRVLLTRGMKGCYVYFQDKETERFFRSRME